MKIKCDGCGHTWTYKGKMKVMATCPDCMKRVRIEKNKVEE
jgi:ribosomal protein S27E